jgi:quinol monooxygenase YgiN
MKQPGMVIKLTAKSGEAGALAQLLVDALELVKPEPGTTPWMALQASDDPNTFFIVDLYTDEAALERHVNGPAAALALGEGRKHLVADPEIAVVELLAGKDVTASRQPA